MIKKLFLEGYLDYRKLVFQNYKSLNLTELDAIVLIKILEISKRGKRITNNRICSETKIPKKDVETAMSDLLEKTIIDIYIEYKNGIGDESYSFTPLFKKLEEIFSDEFVCDSDISKLITLLQEELKRPLTPMELSVCSSWIDREKFSYEEIEKAILEAVKVGKVNFKFIEQQINSNRKKSVDYKPKLDDKTSLSLEKLYNEI